jgi:hypothetical protein
MGIKVRIYTYRVHEASPWAWPVSYEGFHLSEQFQKFQKHSKPYRLCFISVSFMFQSPYRRLSMRFMDSALRSPRPRVVTGRLCGFARCWYPAHQTGTRTHRGRETCNLKRKPPRKGDFVPAYMYKELELSIGDPWVCSS